MPQESAQSIALLSSPVRRDILDTLVNLPSSPTTTEPNVRDLGLTAAELAKRLGRHVTTIRFHVDQLLEGGLVTASDLRGEVGRPRRHYAASKGPVHTVNSDEGYRLLAELFTQAMADGIHSAEDAGRHWVKHNEETILPSCPTTEPASTAGEWLAKIGAVIDVLHGWVTSPPCEPVIRARPQSWNSPSARSGIWPAATRVWHAASTVASSEARSNSSASRTPT